MAEERRLDLERKRFELLDQSFLALRHESNVQRLVLDELSKRTRNIERMLTDLLHRSDQAREQGANPMSAIESFPLEASVPLLEQLQKRILVHPHYQVTATQDGAQMVCRGTLFCPQHPEHVQVAPARFPKGCAFKCGVCAREVKFRPCGRVVIASVVNNVCCVRATRPHASGEVWET